MADAYITRRGTGGKSSGTYVWKKLTAQGGNFIDFVVSDSESAYPDGTVHTDGYWYEKFDNSTLVPENIREGIDIWGVVGTLVEGVAGIDFGEVTISSNSAYNVKVAHNLGVVPSWAALIPKTLSKPSTSKVAENINGKVLYTSTTNALSVMAVSNELTSTEITFRADSAGNYVSQGYYWIAIA